MIVDDPMSSQLVEHDSPVGGDAHRIGDIGQVRKLEVVVGNAITIAGTRRVYLNPIQGTKTSAMIDGDGEACSIEIAANGKSKVFHQAEKRSQW